ncbi:hypothetical protein BROUX41_001691 [Berkeleyomyces rouxiae]|uniref:uncharacterized protein n=1 Tax=Berkeleyomyces rouxiae TaxID=2035830 RepID=UPI003B772D94
METTSSKTINTNTSNGKRATVRTCAIRNPEFAYVRLELTSTSPIPSGTCLDPIQVRSNLSAALTYFMGITGNSIHPDVLKVDGPTAWVRVPNPDLHHLMAALTSWSGWEQDGMRYNLRATDAGTWLGYLLNRRDEENVWKW